MRYSHIHNLCIFTRGECSVLASRCFCQQPSARARSDVGGPSALSGVLRGALAGPLGGSGPGGRVIFGRRMGVCGERPSDSCQWKIPVASRLFDSLCVRHPLLSTFIYPHARLDHRESLHTCVQTAQHHEASAPVEERPARRQPSTLFLLLSPRSRPLSIQTLSSALIPGFDRISRVHLPAWPKHRRCSSSSASGSPRALACL